MKRLGGSIAWLCYSVRCAPEQRALGGATPRLIKRRTMILSAAAAVAPWAAHAQERRSLPSVGYLRRTEPKPAEFAAFRDALKALGYEDGRTIRIEQRHADGNVERLRAHAVELVRMPVRVLVVDGTVTVQTAMAATKTIPIVFAMSSDPALFGIDRLNRPGGNVTGALILGNELQGKRLELLKELIPRLRRVAVLVNPANAESAGLSFIDQSAQAIGVETRLFKAREFAAWPQVFAQIAEYGADAVIQANDATFASRPREIAALAASRQLPVIYGERHYVTGGGLISYGADTLDQWRRAASYVDRVLKGANPADLPIERPVKFELVINLKTAKALGITIPSAVLVRADEVIE